MGLLALFAEFRETRSLSLLGTALEGRDAVLLLALYAIVPVVLLGAALKKFFDYNRVKDR